MGCHVSVPEFFYFYFWIFFEFFYFFIYFFKIFKQIKKFSTWQADIVPRGSDSVTCHYYATCHYFYFCLNLVQIFVKIVQFCLSPNLVPIFVKIITVRHTFYLYLLCYHISITCTFYLFCCSFYLYICVIIWIKKIFTKINKMIKQTK